MRPAQAVRTGMIVLSKMMKLILVGKKEKLAMPKRIALDINKSQ